MLDSQAPNQSGSGFMAMPQQKAKKKVKLNGDSSESFKGSDSPGKMNSARVADSNGIEKLTSPRSQFSKSGDQKVISILKRPDTDAKRAMEAQAKGQKKQSKKRVIMQESPKVTVVENWKQYNADNNTTTTCYCNLFQTRFSICHEARCLENQANEVTYDLSVMA